MSPDEEVSAVLTELRDYWKDEFKLARIVMDTAHSDFIASEEVANAIASLVVHESPEVRSAAIRALAFHGVTFDWQIDPGKTFLDRVLVALRCDPDDDCRRVAAAALGAFFRRTAHENIIRTLASVCLCNEEEQDVRAFAYTSVLDIAGVPREEQPNPFDLILTPQHLERLREILPDLEL